LDKNPQIELPVIVSESSRKNIRFDISFDYEHFNLEKFQKQLSLLGLELKSSVQTVNVLVIKERFPLKD
jgi:hypothetical protein